MYTQDKTEIFLESGVIKFLHLRLSGYVTFSWKCCKVCFRAGQLITIFWKINISLTVKWFDVLSTDTKN